MKINHVIVFLLILLGVSAYGEGRVRGFETNNCSGNFLEVRSLGVLGEYHEHKKEIFGKTWYFKSYQYVDDSDQTCHEYDLEEIEVIGQRLPGSSSGSGVSGSSSGSGGSQPSQGARGVDGQPNPAEEFTDEINEELKECWVEKLEETGTVENWTGNFAEETWSTDTGATWQVSRGNNGALGYTEATAVGTEVSIDVFIYPDAIYAQSQGNYGSVSPTMEHIAIYTQMHEYAHVLQYRHEADDGDAAYIPAPYELFNMELGANAAANTWWRAIFGFGPPIVTSTEDPSAEHRRKTEEYKTLVEELDDDKELSDDDPEKLTEEQIQEKEKKLEDLTNWFKAPENLPKQTGISGTYTSDPEQDIDCDEEEETNDN